MRIPAAMLGATATWEAVWWVHRRQRRTQVYGEALQQARAVGRPLVVIGAPDGGVTSGYSCGDITVDLSATSCPNSFQLDVTKGLPFQDDSVVVFCSCVLEYVSDENAALDEIKRVAGANAYFVGVEPWTLTAYLYPGAQRTLPAAYR